VRSVSRRERLLWYAHRARGMSGRELAHRVRERVRTARLDPDGPAPLTLSERPELDIAGFQALYPSSQEAVREVEETVRTRTVRLLGNTLSLEKPGWYDDPTGWTWSDAPWPEISYRSAGVDPKFEWEVNRLLYLLPLNFHAAHTQNPPAVRSVVRDLLRDWCHATRPNRGLGWTSGIEISLRLLALTALAADESLGIPVSALDRIRSECSHGLHHLTRFPSLFSSANNHRVAELTALLVVGEAWSRPASRADERELAIVAESLFGADGAPLEQSPTYGAFTLELLSIADRFTTWNDTGAERRVRSVIESGAAFLAELVDPRVGILRYGDDDEGRILGVGLSEQSWLSCLGAVLGRRLAPTGSGLRVFENGGLSVVRNQDQSILLFDHGPLGFGKIAAHGHLDQLHVSLHVDGLPWLVDPGTFVYHGDAQWRNYFRAADQHNGPHVLGDPVCLPTGPFNWAPSRPVTTLVEALAMPSGARLAATTRSGAQPAHVTRRDLELSVGALRLHDQGPSAQTIVSRLVFHPACVVEEVTDDGVRLAHPGSTTIMQVRVEEGAFAFEPHGAWVSCAYAEKQRAPYLEVRSDIPGRPLDIVLSWHEATDQGES
jgi:hypothetical protein